MLKDIWLSGIGKETRAQLAIAAYQLSIAAQAPFHVIDLAFAQPGPETASILSAMASQSLAINKTAQLYVYQANQNDTVFIQLFTPVKFSKLPM